MHRRTLGLTVLGILLEDIAAGSALCDIPVGNAASTYEPEFFTSEPRETFKRERHKPTGTAAIKRQAKKNRRRK